MEEKRKKKIFPPDFDHSSVSVKWMAQVVVVRVNLSVET
jgi:hypothetical protein